METEILFASSDWVSAGGLFLVLIGVVFLIAEFFIPSFGLFGFAGIAAILIGIIQLHQTGYIENLPVSINFIIISITLGIALSLLGGWYSWKLYKKKNTTGIEAMVGANAHILEWKDKQGRVHIGGEDWQAYSDEPLNLQKDDDVIISKINGLKIKIISNS
jgi:membrane-bound serine protease (ClpP class)